MKPLPLEDALPKMMSDILSGAEPVQKILENVTELRKHILDDPKMDQYRACKRFIKELDAINGPLQETIRMVLEMQVTAYWSTKLRRRDDFHSYPKKQEVARELNDDLRKYGYIWRHPESGQPCTLLVVASPDEKGRYVLADRLTKKRSCTSTTLLDLLPISLIKEPRRREVFLEQAEKLRNDE